MFAYVFPGQGSQTVGMAKAVVEGSPEARAIFDRADAALGFSLSALCFNGPEEELQLTTNSQPAILTASIALLEALRARSKIVPGVYAGHSLGEYTALVAAGALSFEDAVRAVRKRGELMQAAVPVGVGSMAALGADAKRADELCALASLGDVLAPANYNTPSQTVAAGHKAAIDRLVKLADSEKVAAKELKVSAPFHCQLMQPAADAMRDVLSALKFSPLTTPVVGNVDAKPYEGDPVDRLVRQIVSPVRWEQTVRTLKEMGVTTIVEVGPGKTLSNMVRKIDATIAAKKCETPQEIDVLTA